MSLTPQELESLADSVAPVIKERVDEVRGEVHRLAADNIELRRQRAADAARVAELEDLVSTLTERVAYLEMFAPSPTETR
jgi:hypothetical protein